jgi:hypothetical protein
MTFNDKNNILINVSTLNQSSEYMTHKELHTDAVK